MGNLVKLYHRGNDDVPEGARLTAIFKLTLTADTSGCALSTGAKEEYLFDFIGGGSEFVARNTLELPHKMTTFTPLAREVIRLGIPEEAMPTEAGAGEGERRIEVRPPIAWEGVFLAMNAGNCVGDVTLNLEVDITSPAGKGNGEVQAGPIAAMFGLTYNGVFTKFNGGPNAPGSEHWHVNQNLALGTVPCAGGVAQGTVKINSGAAVPPSYEIEYKLTVTTCGVDTLEMKLVAKPRPGIGPGGIPIPPLSEVKDGDPLPYPLKSPPAGPVVVGPDGQPKP
jgi:hypothetical protein